MAKNNLLVALNENPDLSGLAINNLCIYLVNRCGLLRLVVQLLPTTTSLWELTELAL